MYGKGALLDLARNLRNVKIDTSNLLPFSLEKILVPGLRSPLRYMITIVGGTSSLPSTRHLSTLNTSSPVLTATAQVHEAAMFSEQFC